MRIKQKTAYILLLVSIIFSIGSVSTVASAKDSDASPAMSPIPCEHCKSFLDSSTKSIPHLDYCWYFALGANQGIFDKRGTDEYLILNYYDETVRAYSNRPYELAERFSIKELVSLWHKIYLNTLPKAMISGYKKVNGKFEPVFLYVKLSEPRVISDYTVEFMIFPLNNENLPSGTVIHKAVIDMTEDYKSIRSSSPYHIANSNK